MAKKFLASLLLGIFLLMSGLTAFAEEALSEKYPLQQILIFSRHNLRPPFDYAALAKFTPHEWFAWTAQPGRLSLKGGVRETQMGQYFARRLNDENFMAQLANGDGKAVRFYANSFQRTVATAKYFAAGFMPAQNTAIEYHYALQEEDPVFLPRTKYSSPETIAKIADEIQEYKDSLDLEALLSDGCRLTERALDFQHSEFAKEQGIKHIDVTDIKTKVNNKAATLVGTSVRFMSAADALMLQYIEETDDQKALFGQKFTPEEWKKIGRFKDFGINSFFDLPILSKEWARPLLREMRAELTNDDRKFSFLCGHDTNIVTILSALDVEDYALPDTVDDRAPLGVKIVIEKRLGADGQMYAGLSLVYMTTEDMRNAGAQTANITPSVYPLKLKNISANQDGLYRFEDLLRRIDEAAAKD